MIKTANQEWGLRTVKKEDHDDENLRNHQEKEYDRVQSLLWKSWTPRAKYRDFSYTGMITCWTCWCSVTAETKNKYIKSTWETREYIYYHCTKKKKDMACTEKCITVEKLEDQIHAILESIEIDVDFKKWVFEAIRENYNSEFEAREKIYNSTVSSIKSEEKRLQNLTNMLLDELIDKPGFTDKKREIQEQIIVLKEKRDSIDLTEQKTLETTEQIFDFTFNLTDSFNNGSLQRKKDMISSVGKNFILKDWVLWLELEPWYKVIQVEYPKLVSELGRLEPRKKHGWECNLSHANQKMFKWWSLWERIWTLY